MSRSNYEFKPYFLNQKIVSIWQKKRRPIVEKTMTTKVAAKVETRGVTKATVVANKVATKATVVAVKVANKAAAIGAAIANQNGCLIIV